MQLQVKHSYQDITLSKLKEFEIDDEKISLGKEKIKVVGKSLGVFSPTNPLRIICRRIVQTKYYNGYILVLIAISTIELTFNNPLYDQNSFGVKILGVVDVFMTVIFTLECLINVILYGFLLNSKTSYLRDA